MKSGKPMHSFNFQGFHGEVDPQWKPHLASLLELAQSDPEPAKDPSDPHLVKRNRYRTVRLVPDPSGSTARIYIKSQKFPRWIDRWKYLFLPTRAKTEWAVAPTLIDLGISSYKPLLWAEKTQLGQPIESFLITQEITDAVPLDRFLESLPAEQMLKFLTALAQFVGQIHNKGIRHRDFHQSNLLARDFAAPEIFLIDLHTATHRSSPTPKSLRWQNLAQLIDPLRRQLAEKEILQFLNEYLKAINTSDLSAHDLAKQIQKKIVGIEATRQKSRDKRCLVSSSQFEVSKGISQNHFRRREFATEKLQSSVQTHAAILQNGRDSIVKIDGRSRITRMQDLCVKEILPGNAMAVLEEFFRGSRGRRAWHAAHILQRRQLATPKALGLVERHFLGLPRRSYVVMEFLDKTTELYQFLEKNYLILTRQKRLELLKAAAEFVAKIHRSGLYHRDLQLRNLLVRKVQPWELFLVDLESINPALPLTHRRRLKNLMQLNDCPKTISRTDRLSALRYYETAYGENLTKEDIFSIIQQTTARQQRAAN